MNDCEIVFFNAPIYHESIEDGENYLPPLGQGYIVTQLLKNGIKAEMIDCVNERMGINEVVNIINSGMFPNVAFNVFSINLQIVKSIVEKINRRINWYFGGKAIGHLWKMMLHWEWKNNIVTYTIGECDTIYIDLLLKRCVEKPIYKNLNQIVYEVNKNSVYYPRYLDQFVLNRQLFSGRAVVNHYGRVENCLIASRGCIYNCGFCGGSVYANANSDARMRSTNSIIQEIKEIINIDPQTQSIRILDDLFLKNEDSILQAIEIFEYFPLMHWRCMAHVNSFLKSKNLFGKLKKCGCDEVFIGIESGSAEMRKRIHKSGSYEEIIDTISELLKVGIDVKGYFILGFPNETERQMLQTVRLAKQLKHISNQTEGNFRTTVFQFRPYHGTELYKQLKKEGKLIEEFSVDKETCTKKQYSFTAGNYSAVDNVFLKKCLREIL